MNETVFEVGSRGEYILDVERLVIKFDFFDALSLHLGRMHTSLGYWNTAFHHGEYLQASMGRPAVLNFEDEDGMLPVHIIGVRLSGRIPLGDAQLRYTLEAGNGRGAVPDPPQIAVDANDVKAVNASVVLSSFLISGLSVGANAYFDKIPKNQNPADGPLHRNTDEMVIGGQLSYISGPWEFLAEYFYIHHDEKHAPKAISHGYYVQLAYRLGDWQPFIRYDAVDIDKDESYFTSRVDMDTGAIGVRWDFVSWAALKVQGSWSILDSPGRFEDRADRLSLGVQCAFAF